MASIVLGAVGGYFGGPIGAAIGVAIGSYIDQKYIMPALFPPDDIQGPRLDDLKLTSASEGTPLGFAMGPECRVGATVLWTSDLIEHAYDDEIGGKGGGGQTMTNYIYFVSFAAAYNYGRTMSEVKQILADGKLIYDSNPDINYVSDDISATNETILRFTYNTTLFKWEWQIFYAIAYMHSPYGGPDLSKFRTGVDITISGWTGANAVLNGTYPVLSSFKNSDGTSWVRMINNNAKIASAGDTITLYQDIPTFSSDQIQVLSHYLGSDTQTVESVIEAEEGGSGNVPAFRGMAYEFFNHLCLRHWGNRTPQISIIFEADASPFTIAEGIELLLSRAGFSSAEYDTTALSGNLRGYVARGPFITLKLLQPIMLAFDILAQEDMGKLKFFFRKDADTIEIADEDLAAHEEGSDTPRVVQIQDMTGLSLPSEINVDYIDPTLNYQTGSQRERRYDTPVDSPVQINLPITMDPVDARKIAKRILWTPYANRQTFVLRLPPKYLHIQESDLITFSAYDESFRALVTRVDRGLNGLIVVEAISEDPYTHDFDAVAENAKEHEQVIYTPPMTFIFIIDIAPLIDDDVNTSVVYAAVAAQDVNASWGGGNLLRSSNDTDFTSIANIGPEATMGFAITVLGGGVTGLYWDRINTVTVDLMNGSLESKTEEEVLSGLNHAIVGNEIIGFKTATLVSANRYTLSTLLRGRRDTADAIDNHNTSSGSEAFVYLNSSAIMRISTPTSAIESFRYYKAVASGGDEDDYPSFPHYHRGGSMLPFSPCHITGSIDGSNNITVNWVRRTRALARIFGPGAVPQVEPTRIYEIDVYDGTTIVNTYTVTDAETWTYTSSMQTTDGFTPPLSSLKVEIFQVSSSLGLRGKGELTTIAL